MPAIGVFNLFKQLGACSVYVSEFPRHIEARGVFEAFVRRLAHINRLPPFHPSGCSGKITHYSAILIGARPLRSSLTNSAIEYQKRLLTLRDRDHGWDWIRLVQHCAAVVPYHQPPLSRAPRIGTPGKGLPVRCKNRAFLGS